MNSQPQSRIRYSLRTLFGWMTFAATCSVVLVSLPLLAGIPVALLLIFICLESKLSDPLRMAIVLAFIAYFFWLLLVPSVT